MTSRIGNPLKLTVCNDSDLSPDLPFKTVTCEKTKTKQQQIKTKKQTKKKKQKKKKNKLHYKQISAKYWKKFDSFLLIEKII